MKNKSNFNIHEDKSACSQNSSLINNSIIKLKSKDYQNIDKFDRIKPIIKSNEQQLKFSCDLNNAQPPKILSPKITHPKRVMFNHTNCWETNEHQNKLNLEEKIPLSSYNNSHRNNLEANSKIKQIPHSCLKINNKIDNDKDYDFEAISYSYDANLKPRSFSCSTTNAHKKVENNWFPAQQKSYEEMQFSNTMKSDFCEGEKHSSNNYYNQRNDINHKNYEPNALFSQYCRQPYNPIQAK